jgi:hypothetical protein
MRTCTACGFENQDEAAACLKCGQILRSSLTTHEMVTERNIVVDAFISEIVDIDIEERGTDYFPGGDQLLLVIEKSTLAFYVKGVITIGRKHTQVGINPTVDLTTFGGYHKGVSRRHAEIHLTTNNNLELKDFGSSNGTFLNGTRLTPFQPFKVCHGDRLYFGNIPAVVFFRSVLDKKLSPESSKIEQFLSHDNLTDKND